MADQFEIVNDLIPEVIPVFFISMRSVSTCSDKEYDILLLYASGVELVNNREKKIMSWTLVRDSASEIAHNDYCGLFAPS